MAKSAMDTVISQVHKQFGEESLMRLGSRDRVKVEAISTGSISLDMATGIGGFAKGRISELWGAEGAGKSTISLHTIAQCQRAGGSAVYIDAEHSLDTAYAATLGVDVDNLVVSQPDYGEQALEIVSLLVQSGAIDLIIVDSVAALVPKAELDGEMGDSVTGDTPVFIRRNGMLDIVPIEDLYGGTYTFYGKRYKNLYRKTKGTKSMEPTKIWTHSGWQTIKGVLLKKNRFNKKIIVTKTGFGVAKTTPDHSLFVDGKEVSPSELKLGDRLDVLPCISYNDKCPMSTDYAWLIGYFCADGSLAPTSGPELRKATFGSVDMHLIDKARNIAERTLCVATSLQSDKRPPPRQEFFTLCCSVREDVAAVLRQCYTKRSRLKKVPDLILNASLDIKAAFLEGFLAGDGTKIKYGFIIRTSSYPMAAGLEYLMRCVGIDGYLTVTDHAGAHRKYKGDLEYIIGTNSTGKKRYADNEIRKFIELEQPPEFLYDLETESGTFVAGVGGIVHHNSHMGLHARLMSQAMRKLTGIVAKEKVALIFINQVRDKIGITYGPSETTTGGKALKFYASMRMQVSRTAYIKDGDEKNIGNRTKVKIVKNKLSAPFKEAEFDIIYGLGISREGDVLDRGVDFGLVEKAGSWYSYKGEKLGGSRDKAKKFLSTNTNVLIDIEENVLKHALHLREGAAVVQ